MASRSPGAAVRWLTSQTLVFGAMAALLGIVANAMFLDAYGSAWLPATYIAIGAAGFVLSGAIARAARRFDLLGIAVVVLGAAAVAIGASWLVAAGGDGAWVSAPLLVLFPILIQLGFVFVGAQAGRLLDIAGIKASFPRIAAGFSVGAVLGGLLGGQLVAVLGRTEDLLLATAIAQAAFAGLVWATGRRYPAQLRVAAGLRPGTGARPDDDRPPAPSLRRLLGSRFVVLIVVYQVLSAVGSQLADYLVFDRATAQYPDAADLAGYLAGYTAVMNVISIAFLFGVAGPLLRRYGLRVGIAANPLVLTVFAFGMIAVLGVGGGASFALLATVSAARIADIALTDGTTRTSINALYQVLPERTRLSVQTAVEGMGVPVAIGISGVLIIVLNALPFALAATIVVTTVVCAVWTWSGLRLYREYGPALARVLRRERLLDPDAVIEASPGDAAIARGLVASGSARTARLGIDLLGTMASPAVNVELATLAGDPRPDVRMAALGGLAAAGDEGARRRLAYEVRVGVGDADPAARVRAARFAGLLTSTGRAAASSLLADADPDVRSAALDAVRPGDVAAVARVIAALDDPATIGAASGAIERLGDAVLPSLAEALAAAGIPAQPRVLRLVRSAATVSTGRDELLRRYVGHRDRELGLVVIERLVTAEPAPEATAAALDAVLAADIRHAAGVLSAMTAFDGDMDGGAGDGPVERALADELDLLRSRVRAGVLALYGSTRLGSALVEVAAGGPNGPLAREALEVVLGAAQARIVLALLEPGLPPSDRLARLRGRASDAPADTVAVLRDLVEDADDRWRSHWLRACAIRAARVRGVLQRIDLQTARSLNDPVVDEELWIADA